MLETRHELQITDNPLSEVASDGTFDIFIVELEKLLAKNASRESIGKLPLHNIKEHFPPFNEYIFRATVAKTGIPDSIAEFTRKRLLCHQAAAAMAAEGKERTTRKQRRRLRELFALWYEITTNRQGDLRWTRSDNIIEAYYHELRSTS